MTTLQFSPRGKTLVSGGTDNTVILWDPAAGRLRAQLRGHSEAVTGVLFAPDGRRILSTGHDRTVKIWSARPSPLRLLRGHTGPVVSLVISGDGRRLLSGSGWPEGDKTARLWDLKTGKELRVFRAETQAGKAGQAKASQIGAVAFSPDGKQAVAAGASGVVFLWDVETGKELRRFRGHTGEVSALEFAPNGQQFLSGGQDKTIRLWDVKTGRENHKFEGHTNWVRCVRFNRDGKRFLSGGRDGMMRLWNVDTGKQVRQFQAATKGWTESVAWMPDNRQAVCAGGDSEVQIWDVESGERAAELSRGISMASPAWTCRRTAAVSCRAATIGAYGGGTWPRAGNCNFSRSPALLAPSSSRSMAVRPSPGAEAKIAGDGKYVPGGDDFPIRVWTLGDPPTSPSRPQSTAK